MAGELVRAGGITQASREQAAALVRAIRRAHGSETGHPGLERFTVTDIHDFARRLVEQGVRATEDGAG
jgi:hypothetical protein